MAMDINRLAEVLKASLDPRTNKEGQSQHGGLADEKLMCTAERVLREEENKLGFSVTLLQIVATANYDDVTRLAGALYFKNFIKRWWTVCATVLRRRYIADHSFEGRGRQPQASSRRGPHHQKRAHRVDDLRETKYSIPAW